MSEDDHHWRGMLNLISISRWQREALALVHHKHAQDQHGEAFKQESDNEI